MKKNISNTLSKRHKTMEKFNDVNTEPNIQWKIQECRDLLKIKNKDPQIVLSKTNHLFDKAKKEFWDINNRERLNDEKSLFDLILLIKEFNNWATNHEFSKEEKALYNHIVKTQNTYFSSDNIISYIKNHILQEWNMERDLYKDHNLIIDSIHNNICIHMKISAHNSWYMYHVYYDISIENSKMKKNMRRELVGN